MIKVYESVPQIYYDNSRDFQLFGRLYEIMFNYILMNIDLIKGVPVNDNTNLALVDLALLTLGFSQTHNYTSIDMLDLAKAFKSIVKKKGTKSAIEDCVKLLLRSQHLEKDFIVKIHTLTLNVRDITEETNYDELYTIDIYLPKNTEDIILLEDLFEYILPAGFVYNIYRTVGPITEVTDEFMEKSVYSIVKGTNSSMLFGQVSNSNDLDEANISKTYTGVVTNNESLANQTVDSPITGGEIDA